MSRRRLSSLVLAVVGLLALAARSLVVVDETACVLVTEFGRVVAVHGSRDGEAGPRLKWPWQSALEIDRRLHVFDPAPREVITADKRNLEVAGYVVWRVGDPLRFVRSAATVASAEARLDERVAAALSDAIGRHELAALASTDPKAWALDALTDEVVRAVAPQAAAELGVEVVDVRLRRFNHPAEVRPAVFDLIRSERRQVAAALRAEGEATYQTIVSQADRQRDTALAAADAEAERLRGQAEAESTRLLNEAHARDPRFYEFLRTLDAYKALLDEKSTVVISTTSPLLRLLTHGPPAELLNRPPASAASDARPGAVEARP